jgi:hypothetical protein
MPALYCVVGRHTYVAEALDTMWPVAYRMTREDAQAVLDVCEQQRDAFFKALEPIHNRLTALVYDYRQARSSRKLAREARRRATTDLRRKIRDERERESAVNAKFAGEMLDPLFPTSTNGKTPDVVSYSILEFWDDPREMGAAELIKMRALLHGMHDDEDEEEFDEEL